MAEVRNFFIAALGCPKNIVESELISGAFLAAGDRLCTSPDDADIYIINTCAFLPEARAEAAAEIAEAVAWKPLRPGRRIVVAGCLMNHAQFPEFKEYFPEVDCGARSTIPDGSANCFAEKRSLPEERNARISATRPCRGCS